MCLVLISYKQVPGYPLIVAANRDEFFDRPARPAEYWNDHHNVLAGRDLRLGGTWLGIDRAGRLAAVTNYREPSKPKPGLRSRGFLTSDFLAGDTTPAQYRQLLAADNARYDGFNLFFGDPEELYFCSSYAPQPLPLERGLHGISNGNLDYPWPKVIKGKHAMQAILDAGEIDEPEHYFRLLADGTIPEDESLPQTDFITAADRTLAPIFVSGGVYGTRSSTVIIYHADGGILFTERSFDSEGQATGTVCYEIPSTREAGGNPGN